MSLPNRFRRPKSSLLGESKTKRSTSDFQTSAVTVAKPVIYGREDPNVGASLFAGMTISSSAGNTSDDILLVPASSTSAKRQQCDTADCAGDFSAVLDKQESNLLPEPIQPTTVSKSTGQSVGKKKVKKLGQLVRPGYARQSDNELPLDNSPVNQEQSSHNSSNLVKKEGSNITNPDTSKCETFSENDASDETLAIPIVPLYSIGTPSSSEENLYGEDVHLGTGANVSQDRIPKFSTTSRVLDPSETSAEKLADPMTITEHGSSIMESLENDVGSTDLVNDPSQNMLSASLKEEERLGAKETMRPGFFSSQVASPSENMLSELQEGEENLSDIEPAYLSGQGTDALMNVLSVLQEGRETLSEIDTTTPGYLCDNLSDALDLAADHLKTESDGESVAFERNCNDTEKIHVPYNKSSPNTVCTPEPLKMVITNQCSDLQQKLNTLLQHMKLQLANLSESKMSLTSAEQELINVYRKCSDVQFGKEQQLKDLLVKESHALASDNYDLVEEISNQIEQLRQDLNSSRYKLPANDPKVTDALNLREQVATREVEIYRESEASLQQMKTEQEASLTRHKTTTSTWIVKEKQLLNSERQRLERAMGHLKLDQEHMELERFELQKDIQQQTKKFEARKTELIQDRESLQEEISALEMKLAELRFQEAEFTFAIEQEDNKIEMVKMQFSPQQKLLDKQKQDIEGRQKSLDSEFNQLSSAQKKFDNEVEEQNNKEQTLVEIVAAVSDEVEKSAQAIIALEKQQQRVQEFLKMEHFILESDSKLTSFQVKQSQLSQEIEALSTKTQKAQRGMGTIRKALNDTEAQICELDAAKEIAKKERNFKEAKRLKEEKDALTEEGVENQAQLESLLQEIAEDKKKLEELQGEGEDLNKEISEYEHCSALSKVEKATLVFHTLQNQICRIPDDSLIVILLEAEAETCRNLITDLCAKHDLAMPDLPSPRDVGDGQEYKDVQLQENEDEQSGPILSEEREKWRKEHEELTDKISELEGRLEAVVDVEDFDEADRLQQEIETLKERLEGVTPL